MQSTAELGEAILKRDFPANPGDLATMLSVL